MADLGHITLVVYAIHPIMYQTPIFQALQRRIDSDRIPISQIVLFGDDISLRPVYFDEIKTTFQPDTPTLLDGYDYVLMKNYARDSRAGFLSRINLEIFGQIWGRKADIVLVHGYESLTSWMVVLAAKLSGAKLIWRGEVTPRQKTKGPRSRLRNVLLRWYLTRFDALMYSCSGNLAFLEQVLGDRLRATPHTLIPCAVDNDFFCGERDKLMPKREAIRASLGIEPGDFVTMTCARLTTRKRPLDLLEAIALVNDKRHVALMVGDGPEKPRLEERAKELGVRAVFVGFVNQSEVSRYYVAADAFVILSDYDPSPKALNEAMNFNLPVIVTEPVGTAFDLVEPGHNGERVKVGDLTAIAEAIAGFAAAPEKTRAQGAVSTEIVANWNFEVNASSLLLAIANVTGQKHPGFTVSAEEKQ